MEALRRHAPALLVLALLCAAAGLTFGHTLDGAFFWDDFGHLASGAEIHRSGFDRGVLRGYFFMAQAERYFRSLPFLFDGVDHWLYGGSPRGWHLSTLGFHVVAAWLLFFLGRALGLRRVPSAAAALLFCVHPMVGRTVSWVTLREETIAAVSILATLRLFWVAVAPEPAPPRRRVAAALAAAGLAELAFFSKETALTLPLLALVLAGAGAAAEGRRPLWTRLSPRLLATLPMGLALWINLGLRRTHLGSILPNPISSGGTPFPARPDFDGVLEFASGAAAFVPAILGAQLVPVRAAFPAEGVEGIGGATLALLLAGALAAIAVLGLRGALTRGAPRRVLVAGSLLWILSPIPALPFILRSPHPLDMGKVWSHYLPAAFACLVIAALAAGARGRTRVPALVLVVALAFGYATGARAWARRFVQLGAADAQALADFRRLPDPPPAGSTLYFLDEERVCRGATILRHLEEGLGQSCRRGDLEELQGGRRGGLREMGERSFVYRLRARAGDALDFGPDAGFWVPVHDELADRLHARRVEPPPPPLELCAAPHQESGRWYFPVDLAQPWRYAALRVVLEPGEPVEPESAPPTLRIYGLEVSLERQCRPLLRGDTLELPLAQDLRWLLEPRIQALELSLDSPRRALRSAVLVPWVPVIPAAPGRVGR